MPFGRPRAEPRRKTLQKLTGQRDFRHQHQRLPAGPQSRGDSLEINLGLARAGDAFQQKRTITARRYGDRQRRRRELLFGFENGRRKQRIERAADRRRRGGQRLQRALVDQRVDHRSPAAGRLHQRLFGEGQSAFRRRQRAGAGGREALRRRASEAIEQARRGRPRVFSGACGETQRHAARGQSPARQPVQKIA